MFCGASVHVVCVLSGGGSWAILTREIRAGVLLQVLLRKINVNNLAAKFRAHFQT